MERRSSVALRYDNRLPAPLVVARGRGDLANRLLQIAEESQVPVVESAALAESLVVLEPGELIPESFYEAVAEVLSFVWRVAADRPEEKKVWDEEHQGQ
jgi:flagellar biosynthesis protein